MRNSTRITLAFVAAAAMTAAVAIPASAATDDTTATVEVQGGLLSITAPASVALTGVTPGNTATGTLVGVSVSDQTADALGWTSAVSITDFVSGGLTIGAANVTYVPTAAVVTGTATTAETTATNGAGTVQVASAVTGNNTATWDGAISVAVPSDAIAASDYTATLTHSVL